MNKAYFAGGCFWCISDYILSLKIPGIIDVISGYCGGDEVDVTYELVKSQKTKHRETIEILYDENFVSLKTLLEIYAAYVDIHDQYGQYIDKGYSYTLALYYTNKKELEIYKNFVSKLDEPAYISIEPFKFFVEAEEYHQHFGSKNPDKMLEEIKLSNRVCHINLYAKTNRK